MNPAPLTVRVVKVIRETADAHSLVLEPTGAQLTYRPGQFLTVRVPSERDGHVARCYSLCSSPQRDEQLKVTVKRTVGGYASHWICDHVTEGDTLEVLRPAGTFTPRSLDEDLLLIAAGSGITPVLSILTSCLHAGTARITLLYANRGERDVIFRDELLSLAQEFGDRLTVLHWLESVQGRPSADTLRGLIGPYASRRAFVCGPGPFMDVASHALATAGVAPDRITVERFTSLTGDPFAAPDPEPDTTGALSTVDVELDGERRTVSWPHGHTLLEALLADGVDAPYSCREGNCSACACVLVDGDVAMDRNEVLDADDLADGLVLACQARPLTDRLKVTYDAELRPTTRFPTPDPDEVRPVTKATAAIVGSGNIGTDLMYKLLRSPSIEPRWMIGIDEQSPGLKRAADHGLHTGADGVERLLAGTDRPDLIFEATSASVHRANAPKYAELGIQAIDLTPAALGPAVVPAVNLGDHLDAADVSLITCGGQATIPLVAAVSQVCDVGYAEIVASVASPSAGPGTRANIDEFTRTTSRGIETIGGAGHGKAIIILNPAEPPMLMQDTVFCALPADVDRAAVTASIHAMVARVAAYVPGYRLRAEPQFDDPTPMSGGLARVAVFLEVEGAGDFLPPYAGNLDIMTAAATKVGEGFAQRIVARRAAA